MARKHPALEMTRVILPLASLMPAEVERDLRDVVGGSYPLLTELERVILMLAHRFTEIGNADIQPYRPEHPRDIGECLRRLVDAGWLRKSGLGRGTRYQLPDRNPQGVLPLGQQMPESSEHYVLSSEHYEVDSEHYARLAAIAAPVRSTGRASSSLVRRTLIALCSEDFLSLRLLAHLLNRSPDTLRNHYLAELIESGQICLRHPGNPNHPHQGYRATQEALRTPEGEVEA